MGRPLAARLAPLALLLPALACSGNEVSLTIDSRAVGANVAWYDIAVIEATNCKQALPNMVAGIPQDAGSLWSGFGVGVSNGVPPLGAIKKGTYTFAVSAKDANCGTIGLGCTDMEVTGGETVTVVIQPTSNPGAGACEPTYQCIAANCIPRPTTGTGSDGRLVLERTGDGDFGDPYGGVGTIIGPPALVARDGRFLLAYREQGAAGTRLTTRTLGPDGLAAAPVERLLEGRCALPEGDATTAAAGDKSVVVGLTRPPCPTTNKGGIDLLEVGDDGVPVAATFTGNTGVQTAFPSNGALAFDPSTKAFVAAFDTSGVATVASTGTTLVLGSGARVGDGSAAAGPVTISEAMAALLTSDGRGLSLRAGRSADGAAQGRVVAQFPGAQRGALWAAGRAVYVAVALDEVVDLSRYEVAADFLSARRTDHTTAPLEGAGAVHGLALTGRPDRLFVAASRKGAVDLISYKRDGAYLQLETHRPLADGAFFSTPSEVRDGGVAVAATDSAVAVAWTRSTTTIAGDTPGGWSVFAAPVR